MTQVEKGDPLGVSFSPRRSMPEIKSANPNFVSQLKRNSYQEESRINVRLELLCLWLKTLKLFSDLQLDGFGHHSSVPSSFISSYRNSFSGHPSRRESSDSGYLMSLPESRRDSDVDSFATGGHCINTNYGRIAMDLRRDSEDFLSSSIHQHPLKVRFSFRSIFGLHFSYLFILLLIHSVWKSPKMSHLSFWILAFSTNFWPIKTDLSGNPVWPQALDFQKFVIFAILGIFDQNVNIARFARNVEWDFFCDFQTPCLVGY